ncbi:MAG TPA: hypothetical protein DCX27_17875 [Balneola sp.]|nr:hypothetical protein [Balneola sp.]
MKDDELKSKNKGFRIALTIIVLLFLSIGVIATIKTYDLDNIERVNITDRMREPMVQNYDGCTYIRFAHTHEYIHKANCSNPVHKTEGK